MPKPLAPRNGSDAIEKAPFVALRLKIHGYGKFFILGPIGQRPARDADPASTFYMNQLVRPSQIGDADAVAEPSAELRVPFAQSGAFVCKFIIGEPNDRAVCCGAPAPDGKSWCAFHRRIVFEPARPGRLR